MREPPYRIEPPPEAKRYPLTVRRVTSTYRSLWIGEVPIGVVLMPINGVINAHIFAISSICAAVHIEETQGWEKILTASVQAYFKSLKRHEGKRIKRVGKSPIPTDERVWELEYKVVP